MIEIAKIRQRAVGAEIKEPVGSQIIQGLVSNLMVFGFYF